MTVALEKQPYESLFVVPPETSQDKIDGFIEKIKTAISKADGNLRGVQVWGRRRMAYPIKRHKDGLYIYVDFDGATNSVTEISNLFSVTDFVIRHMTVVREEPPPPPKRKRPVETATAAATPSAPSSSPSTPKESDQSPS